MAYTTYVELSPIWTDHLVPVTVMWRVTRWELTDDHRWKVAALSEHSNGDWLSALSVARQWFRLLQDEVEKGRTRIKVDPVNMPSEHFGQGDHPLDSLPQDAVAGGA